MPKYEINVIELPYEFNALEPYISEQVLKYHYEQHKGYLEALKQVMDKHPKTFKNYLNGSRGELNNLLSNYCKLEDTCQDLDNCNIKKLQSSVRQFGGGLINHNFYFLNLKKNQAFNPDSNIGKLVIKKFGSYQNFSDLLIKTAMDIFGSGWVWLVIDNSGTLRFYKTFNQDNPWFLNMTPLIAVNVWEHAYFLQYKNDRKSYIKAVLNIIDWNVVENHYQEYLQENK